MNYYEAFYKSEMQGLYQYLDQKLRQWARRKYKTLTRHKRRSGDWLSKMKDMLPRLFVYWRAKESRVG